MLILNVLLYRLGFSSCQSIYTKVNIKYACVNFLILFSSTGRWMVDAKYDAICSVCWIYFSCQMTEGIEQKYCIKFCQKHESIPILQGRLKRDRCEAKGRWCRLFFSDAREIVHHKYAPEGQTVTRSTINAALMQFSVKKTDTWKWYHESASGHSSNLIQTTICQPHYFYVWLLATSGCF